MFNSRNTPEVKRVFTYVRAERQLGERRRSYCVYGAQSDPIIYYKTDIVEYNKHSRAYGMKAIEDGRNPIVVKKYDDQLNLQYYPENTTAAEIDNYIQKNMDYAIHEAQFNAIAHNGGGFYHEEMPTVFQSVIINNQPVKKLISHTHIYAAMDFVPGLSLENHVIHHAAEFISISIAILEALAELHLQFIHTDISANKIILQKNSSHHFRVRFIGFANSRFAGQICALEGINRADKPPEYVGATSLIAAANQDVFAVAFTLQKILEKNKKLFFNKTKTEIQSILTLMAHPVPGWRIDVSRALTMFKAIDKYPEKIITAKIAEIFTVINESTHIFKHQIANWCYYTTLQYLLNTAFTNSLEPEVVAFMDNNPQAIKALGTDGIVTRFTNIFNSSEKFFNLLRKLDNTNHALILLIFLHQHRKNYLATIINQDIELAQLINILAPGQLVTLLSLLTESVINQIERANPQPGELTQIKLCYAYLQTYCLQFHPNYFTQDVWQAYKNLIAPRWEVDFVQAYATVASNPDYNVFIFFEIIPASSIPLVLHTLGITSITSKISSMREFYHIFKRVAPDHQAAVLKLFSKEYIGALQNFPHGEMIKDLNDFTTIIANCFDIGTGLKILKNYCREVFIRCQQDWNATLEFLDQFNQPEQDLYIKLLYCANQLYRDQRSTQENSMKTLFGAYSRSDKIKASEYLEMQLDENKISHETFKYNGLVQGHLGKIALRIKEYYLPTPKPLTILSRFGFPPR